jgi:hypothetical protein
MKNHLFILILFLAFTNIKAQIVINEINYKDATDFQTKDWIELYNNGSSSVDISNWVFKDDDDTHEFVIPNGTTIPSDSYLVLVQILADFQTLFPAVSPILGDFTFGLSGGGELIQLFDAAGNLVDSVEYDDVDPWPTEPDGNGPTLELTNPNLDNALASSWSASTGHGTPGQQNSAFALGLESYENSVSVSIFPNPLTDKSIIRLSNNVIIKSVLVYNILGNEVKKIESNSDTTILKKENLKSGIYLLQILSKSGKLYTQKLIIN